MRRLKWKSVIVCLTHGARLCLDTRKLRKNALAKLVQCDGTPVTDWSWTSPDTDSCWNKFHNFYQQHGLFNNNFSLAAPNKCKFAGYIYTSSLYQKKYSALGIQVKLKPGREAGMGRINEQKHMIHSKNDSSQETDNEDDKESEYDDEDSQQTDDENDN